MELFRSALSAVVFDPSVSCTIATPAGMHRRR
jgi:hypothetical protein